MVSFFLILVTISFAHYFVISIYSERLQTQREREREYAHMCVCLCCVFEYECARV